MTIARCATLSSECRDTQRPLRSISALGCSAAAPAELIAAGLDARQEVKKIGLQIGLIVLRRYPVDARRTILARQAIGLGSPFEVDQVMQRGQHPLRVAPRQSGYPLAFRGQVCRTQSSLPCFPSMGLHARRLPSLRRVPASPVPRHPRYYEAATTSRHVCSVGLCLRLRNPYAP